MSSSFNGRGRALRSIFLPLFFQNSGKKDAASIAHAGEYGAIGLYFLIIYTIIAFPFFKEIVYLSKKILKYINR
jgi:hypothetical protein